MKTELNDVKACAFLRDELQNRSSTVKKKIKSRSRKKGLQMAGLENLRDALVAMKFIVGH